MKTIHFSAGHIAPAFDEVGAIMAYEAGSLDDEKTLDLFQHLVDNGHAWTLQGSYGRTARRLLDSHQIRPARRGAGA